MASIQPQNIVIGFTPVAKLIRMNAKFIIAFNTLFIQIRFEWLGFSLSGTLMRSSSTNMERQIMDGHLRTNFRTKGCPRESVFKMMLGTTVSFASG